MRDTRSVFAEAIQIDTSVILLFLAVIAFLFLAFIAIVVFGAIKLARLGASPDPHWRWWLVPLGAVDLYLALAAATRGNAALVLALPLVGHLAVYLVARRRRDNAASL